MEAPVAALLRTEGAPQSLPEIVPFGIHSVGASIGRAETNTVSFNDKKVSKIHCRLSLRTCKRKGSPDGEIMRRLFCRDSSTFGTFVNGKALPKEQWVMLEEGDVLGLRNPHGNTSLGEYRVRYQDAGAGDLVGEMESLENEGGVAALPRKAPLPLPTKIQQSEAPARAPLPRPPSVVSALPSPIDAPKVEDDSSKIELETARSCLGGAEELSPLEEDEPANVQAPPSPLQPLAEAPATDACVEEVSVARASAEAELSPVSDDEVDQSPPAKPAAIREEPCPPVEVQGLEGQDASGGHMEMHAEPLSPLSEVSEVSAPEAAPPQGLQSSVPHVVPGLRPVPMLQYILPPGAPMLMSPQALQLASLSTASSKSGSAAPPTSLSQANAPFAAAPVAVTVPAELVGMLIGKGGETIKQLSKDSGAKIEISRTPQDLPNGGRTVYLSGPAECVDRAKKMIDETLEKARERSGPLAVSNPNAQVMKVQHELIGMLIGKAGETIKELKKESGARIDISKEPMDSTNDRLVHISGPPECVEYAKKMIDEMLGKSREHVRGSLGDDKGSPNQVSILVAHELIGMLIGKGGETIKQISKDSACRIEICKDDTAQGEDKRPVILSGPSECIQKAKVMIEETLNRSRERQRSRSRGYGRGRSRSRSRSAAKRPKGPLVLNVPQEVIGMLIGKGGETIRNITRDTGAKIEISKEERADLGRMVTIGGTDDSIAKARDAIDRIVVQARDKTGRRDLVALPALGDEIFEDTEPIKESYLCEKLYIDECDMPYRPNFTPEHEDGLPTDLEVFIRGFSKACVEKDLWEHLYRSGATDVKEILLLRQQSESKGMAYVVFNRHDHAVLAKQKLHGTPAAQIPCGGGPPAEGVVTVRFSESERWINGRSNVYGTDMVHTLLTMRPRFTLEVRLESGLRKVLMTGRNMKSFRVVDEDPRLHLVIYYEPEEVGNAAKAVKFWGDTLSAVHFDIGERMGKGKGFPHKGKGKGWPEYFDPWAPMMMHPPPPMHPPVLPDLALTMEAPVLMRRLRLSSRSSGSKVFEATCLKGRELRWQPWPEVSSFNEEWSVLPMRWGLRGELFALLRRRDTGETKVCAAEVHLPLDKWPVLTSGSPVAHPSRTMRYKSFTFNEHLFLIGIDRAAGVLKVFHVPEPSSPWNVAFETKLRAYSGAELPEDALGFSRSAKLCVFYAQDRSPHVVASDAKHSIVRFFRIVDPGKRWTPLVAPTLSPKAWLHPVYVKARSPNPTDFEVCVFSIDPTANELEVFSVPADTSRAWLHVNRVRFAGDTRLSCIYVPGKPEPLLMVGSPTERMQKLCHLNLIEWCMHRRDERMPAPKVPIVEEKFSRPMASLWPPESRSAEELSSVVALPKDCTADLPVSRHIWVSAPVGPPPDVHVPPFDGRFPQYPHGPPPVGHYDPRGPPPFDYRPPLDYRPPHFDSGKGKGPFDIPPFDMSKGSWPPPPFDAGKGKGPPPFGGPPPFDMGKGGGPPFDRPPIDSIPAVRPPFEAPPGQWFGGGQQPPALADGVSDQGGASTTASGTQLEVVDTKAEGERKRHRRRRHAAGVDGVQDQRDRDAPIDVAPVTVTSGNPDDGTDRKPDGEPKHHRRRRHRRSDKDNAAEPLEGDRVADD